MLGYIRGDEWTIPAERMKSRGEHRVQLAGQMWERWSRYRFGHTPYSHAG